MRNWIGSKTAAAGQQQDKKQKGLWPLGGRDIRNPRHQRAEDTINPVADAAG